MLCGDCQNNLGIVLSCLFSSERNPKYICQRVPKSITLSWFVFWIMFSLSVTASGIPVNSKCDNSKFADIPHPLAYINVEMQTTSTPGTCTCQVTRNVRTSSLKFGRKYNKKITKFRHNMKKV